MFYRTYIPKDRSYKCSHSSRVSLLKCRTPRQIYDSFVQTGELPRLRAGGIDAELDVPVRQFGDFDDAMSFTNSVLITSGRIKDEASSAAEAARLAREKEMADAYAKLHNNSNSAD